MCPDDDLFTVLLRNNKETERRETFAGDHTKRLRAPIDHAYLYAALISNQGPFLCGIPRMLPRQP